METTGHQADRVAHRYMGIDRRAPRPGPVVAWRGGALFSGVWLLAVTLLAGCAIAPPSERGTPSDAGPARSAPQAEEPAAQPPQSPRKAEPPASSAIPPAVTALVRRAEAASAQGRQEDAAAHLERALHIAPENPVLWQNLAVVRYRQGHYQLAESLALRSNRLAGRDTGLEARNWALIAATRRLNGNEDGARVAEQRAAQLREAGSR